MTERSATEATGAHAAAAAARVGSPPPVVDPGTPGAAARRELERRRALRAERARVGRGGPDGGSRTTDRDAPSTVAWERGTSGAEQLGGRLDEIASGSLRLLHDRLVAGGSADIDHLAVTPTGVHVIDARRYDGRPRLRVDGGLLRPRTERLLVGGRDRTRLVDGMHEQVAVVRGLVDDAVPVRGVLCFVDADWPLLGGGFEIRGVSVVRPQRLCRSLARPGPLRAATLDDVHRRLAATLAPA